MRDLDTPATATRCRQCRKPIIWPGRCYSCATGLPRHLTRRQAAPDEAPTPDELPETS